MPINEQKSTKPSICEFVALWVFKQKENLKNPAFTRFLRPSDVAEGRLELSTPRV